MHALGFQDEGVEQVAHGLLAAEVFGMPLDSDHEGMAQGFDGFHKAVFAEGGRLEAGSDILDSLVMHAVRGKMLGMEHHGKLAAGNQFDRMAGEAVVGLLPMRDGLFRLQVFAFGFSAGSIGGDMGKLLFPID